MENFIRILFLSLQNSFPDTRLDQETILHLLKLFHRKHVFRDRNIPLKGLMQLKQSVNTKETAADVSDSGNLFRECKADEGIATRRRNEINQQTKNKKLQDKYK